MGFHFSVALGFSLGPFLIRPFFPEADDKSSHEVCHLSNDSISNNPTLNSNIVQKPDIDLNVLEIIKWPYIIVACGHFLFSVMYLLIIYLPYPMPGNLRYFPLSIF